MPARDSARARLTYRVTLAIVGFGLSACSTVSEEDSPDAELGTDAATDLVGDSDAVDNDVFVEPRAYDESVSAGPTGLRRLTHAQFENVIADVIGADIVVPPLAEPDLEIGGLLSVGASSVSMSPRGVETLEASAFSIAEQALASDEFRTRWVTCEPSAPLDDACSEEVLAVLGLHLWRRPLTNDELEQTVAIAGLAAETLEDFHAGIEFGLAALLQSPNFIFRAELGSPTDGDEDVAYDAFELASRLSFFLWNTTPDTDLLALAADGSLLGDDVLRETAEAMIDDPRTRRGLRNYFSEQLQLHGLERLSKDPTLFEQYSVLLGPDAAEETLLMLEHVVFDAESDFRDVMTTRETFVNRRLAALYDIPAPVPEGFGFVELPADRFRVGLLGQASWANLHGHAVSSSATLRGKAIREILLCSVVPPPPPDVDVSIPEPSGETRTLRERVAEHLVDPACSGCHDVMDPIGLGLENFDAIGVWRERDNGALIDVSGDLDGAEFANPVELAERIRNHENFAPCVVRTLTRYAIGRAEIREEIDHLDVLSEHFRANQYRIKPILLEIVMSPMFRNAGVPQ